jgi:hypothetical protein
VRDADHPVKRAVYGLIMRFFQPQDQVNFYAARHLRMAESFNVPPNRYREVAASLRALAESEPRGAGIYNPIGRFMHKEEDGTEFLGYPMRVASVEGMRRAALVTQQLRARGIAPAYVPTELAHSNLRDPYSEAAFEWDPGARVIVFDDRGDHRWHRSEYLY